MKRLGLFFLFLLFAAGGGIFSPTSAWAQEPWPADFTGVWKTDSGWEYVEAGGKIEKANIPYEQRQALTEEALAAMNYTYEVTPLLAPFNAYVYVKTDNPNPSTFMLVDEDSRYYSADAEEESVPQGSFLLVERLFADVKYENESTWRVKGGYVFVNKDLDADGGALRLYIGEYYYMRPGSDSGYYSTRVSVVPTSVTVNAPEMIDYVDYLIQEKTGASMGLFEKLDAIQAYLNAAAVYPFGVMDAARPSSRPYPFLATSPYFELTLNQHLEVFESHPGGLLSQQVYPFVLDSAGFPGTMRAAAGRLEPNCEITSGTYHYLTKVSFNGESKSYGGAGSGGSDEMLSNRVESLWKFDGSPGDYAGSASLDKLRAKLMNYKAQATKDIQVYRDQISGQAIAAAIGPGEWAQVAREGWFGYGLVFTYLAYNPGGSGYNVVTSSWVDGKYINQWENMELGATFDEYPTADIVVRNAAYTDKNGKSHQNDIVYQYYGERDRWEAHYYYNDGWSYSTDEILPSDFILTREQARAIVESGNTDALPTEGIIIDGTEYPGTRFSRRTVTGIRLSQTSLTVEKGEQIDLAQLVTVLPGDAFEKRFTAVSSDSEMVSTYESTAYANMVGQAVITIKTVDGAFPAELTITVNGLKQNTSGQSVYYKDNKAQTSFIGIYFSEEKEQYYSYSASDHVNAPKGYFIEEGIWKESFNGLYTAEDGTVWCIENGMVSYSYYNREWYCRVYVTEDGNACYILDGKVDTSFTGFLWESLFGKYGAYLFEKGVWARSFTGLKKDEASGKTWYVERGIRKGYQLRFDANGGENAPEAIIGEYAWLDSAPSRQGHAFVGWAQNASSTQAEYERYSYLSLDDSITLYAVWKELYSPGDINGDGAVNIFDVIRLLKKVTGENAESFADTDVNGDGSVNIFDVIRLLKHVTGENVEIQ